ncbi:MAG: hypothetical protein NVSMB57_16920 [Actinomycetota bacterium]
MRRIPAILPVAALSILAVVAGRKLLHSAGPEIGSIRPVRTGRAVPLTVDLAPGLTQSGTLRCAELKRSDGSYAATVEGGSVVNTTDAEMSLSFTLTISSRAETESVSRPFALPAKKDVGPFTVASKSLAQRLESCGLKIVVRGAASAELFAVRAAAAKAGCQGPAEQNIEGRSHVPEGTSVAYKSKPPTSGDHYAKPAHTGVQTQQIRNEAQVHNLEHGHVGLQYRGVSPATIEALASVTRSDAREVFSAPYNDMPQKIAMTAWGVSLSCTNEPPADQVRDLAQAFVKAYEGHAPENIAGTPA